MVPKGLLVTPETWRVAREDGRLIFLSQTSGRPLEREGQERQIEVMHGMAVWSLLVNALEVSNGRLLNHAMASRHQQRQLRRITDRNHAVLALATPTPEAVRALLDTEPQLNLWRDAA